MGKRWRRGVTAWLLVWALLAGTGCAAPGSGPGPGGTRGTQAPGAGPPGGTARVRVVASFYPLGFFASQVGGDRVEVSTLIPTGVEPHAWEPRASDIRKLSGAQVFIYSGAGLEPWVDRVLDSLDRQAVVVVDTSEGIALLGAHAEDEHGHPPTAREDGRDPHIWLDPVLNLHQVRRIADALGAADPRGVPLYAANAEALAGQLRLLDRDYASLRHCPRQEIVISHAFFAYPAQRYGLTQVPIAGPAPGAEPTPKQLAELVTLVRQHQVGYVFFESLVSPRLAQVIAGETGARALVLNPIEGLTREDEAAGRDFLSLMRDNLANLRLALGCDQNGSAGR